jgi:nucleoside-diphosphate-sugar epimerase
LSATTKSAVRTGRQAPGRVLVTGATWLLGSNLIAELLAAGAEVLALARRPEEREPGVNLPSHLGDHRRRDGSVPQ